VSVSKPTRRHVIAGVASIGACGLIGIVTPRPATGADVFTVGFVYIGPRIDWGWNQSFSDAAEVLGALPNTNVVEAEYLPETTDYASGKKTPQNKAYADQIKRLVRPDGAKLIFSTSYGKDPFLYAGAKNNPQIAFRHLSDLPENTDIDNLGSQNALIHQAHYVNGVAAGLCTKTNKLGFVIGETSGSVLLNVNSFLLGSRKTNSKATVHITTTGGWESESPEVTATNRLIDDGCDVITCHLDSPKAVIETAEARGVRTCGHAYNQGPLAPKGYITGAEYVWARMYRQFVEKARTGRPLPDFVIGGYDKGYVTSSPFGAGATPEAIQAAKAAIAAMKADEPIFVGPIRDNAGKIVIPAGKRYGPYAPELQRTDYLVAGVVGSIE